MKTRKHRGAFKTSKRQQSVYRLLKMGWQSSGEIFAATFIPNPAGAVSDLRKNGIPVEKKWFIGRDGKKLVRWRVK